MQVLKTFVLLILLLNTFFCFSQFNDSIEHQFKFSSTGVINKTGDASSYLLNNGIQFNIEKRKVSLSSGASWIYGEQQKKLSNNDLSSFANVDINKNINPLYYWGLLTFDKSYSLKINYRLQAGAGLGYTVLKKENAYLVLSDGLLFETGDLYRSDLGQDHYNIPRNSFRLKYRFSIKNVFIIEGSNYYQPSLIQIDDYIIQMNNSLSIPLRKWLAITASASYNKVSRTQRENLLFTYGITVEKWY